MISFNDNELSDLELEMTDTENDIYEGKHISPLELSLHSNGSRTRSSSEYSEHNSSNINNFSKKYFSEKELPHEIKSSSIKSRHNSTEESYFELRTSTNNSTHIPSNSRSNSRRGSRYNLRDTQGSWTWEDAIDDRDYSNENFPKSNYLLTEDLNLLPRRPSRSSISISSKSQKNNSPLTVDSATADNESNNTEKESKSSWTWEDAIDDSGDYNNVSDKLLNYHNGYLQPALSPSESSFHSALNVDDETETLPVFTSSRNSRQESVYSNHSVLINNDFIVENEENEIISNGQSSPISTSSTDAVLYEHPTDANIIPVFETSVQTTASIKLDSVKSVVPESPSNNEKVSDVKSAIKLSQSSELYQSKTRNLSLSLPSMNTSNAATNNELSSILKVNYNGKTPITILTGFKNTSYSLMKYITSKESSSSKQTAYGMNGKRVCFISKHVKSLLFQEFNGCALMPLTNEFLEPLESLISTSKSPCSVAANTNMDENMQNDNNDNSETDDIKTTGNGLFSRHDFDAIILDMTGININIGAFRETLSKSYVCRSNYVIDHILCLYEINPLPTHPSNQKSLIYLMNEIIAVSSELIILVTKTKETHIQKLLKTVIHDSLSINRYLKVSFRHPKSYQLNEMIEQGSLDIQLIGQKLDNAECLNSLNTSLPMPSHLTNETLVKSNIITFGITVYDEIYIESFNNFMNDFMTKYGHDIYQCHGLLCSPFIEENDGNDNNNTTECKYIFQGIQNHFTLVKAKQEKDNKTNPYKDDEENRYSKLVFICKQSEEETLQYSTMLVSLLKNCLVYMGTKVQLHSS